MTGSDRWYSSRRLCSDSRRALIALVASLIVPTVIGTMTRLTPPPGAGGVATQVVLVLLGWNVFAVVYMVLTAATFSGLDASEFQARIALRAPHPSVRWLSPLRRGPTFAVESAVVAFGVVLVVPHIKAISIDEWLLVPVTLSILLSSLALSVVSYALHYAQNDIAEPGLEFPGTRTQAYADYLYFSLAVATTFGATDVNITTPRMRRVVNLHTMLTFLYNSVIVALLASLLIR